MALSAATVWNVRTDGDDTNGGGYVSGGTDHSLQAGTVYSVTDGVTNGTTTITSATAAFGTDVVGNIMYVQGGTGSVVANRYQIITRTSATAVVVDRTTGLTSGTGVTLKIGGALLSPGLLTSSAPCSAISGNAVNIKSGTYNITATTAVAGGVIAPALRIKYEGYGTTPGDLGTAPQLVASGISSAALVSLATDGSMIVNIGVSGASLTAIRGFTLEAVVAYRCYAALCPNSGFGGAADTTFVDCWATLCETAGFIGGSAFYCTAHDNAAPGFSNVKTVGCIADSNTGGTSDGFLLGATDGVSAVNCVSYNNDRDGFRCTADANLVMNCLSASNTGVGVNGQGTGTARLYCGTHDETATGGTIILEQGNITGTGSFFTDAPNRDFSLNNTSGAGASARAAGFPGALLDGGTGYIDMGALQHQDSGSGGGSRGFGMTGGMS